MSTTEHRVIGSLLGTYKHVGTYHLFLPPFCHQIRINHLLLLRTRRKNRKRNEKNKRQLFLASSVNRTRASSMATMNSTTRPMMLVMAVKLRCDLLLIEES
jgi:hypothetical protein